jgi:hypothetical protein
MPLNADQLRQLLTERSDPARYHPAPEESLTTRIRHARTRRVAVVSLLAVAAVAAVVSVVSVVSLPSGHPSGNAATSAGQQFPGSFTAADGAYYTRVATTSLAGPVGETVTIKIKATQAPVDVMAACDPSDGVGAVSIAVNGVPADGFSCPGPPRLIALSAGSGREADITFTEVPVINHPNVTASSRFAVYEGKLPAIPRLPASYTGYNTTTGHGMALRRLIVSGSGDWPADRTVTLTMHSNSHNIDISLVCSGAIADKLQVTMVENGQGYGSVPCSTSTPSEQAPGQIVLGDVKPGKQTFTFRLQGLSAAATGWAIGVYEEEY